MYLLAIGSYEIDTATVALIAAILALIGVVLNATWLETRRRRIELETQKKALRTALYSEIGWTLTKIAPILPKNVVLAKFGPVKLDWRDLIIRRTLSLFRMLSAFLRRKRFCCAKTF